MRKNNQIDRVSSLINNDRLNLSDEYLNLFTSDIYAVLGEYLDCSGMPKIEIFKSGSNYIVSVTACAQSIKYFSKLPNN